MAIKVGKLKLNLDIDPQHDDQIAERLRRTISELPDLLKKEMRECNLSEAEMESWPQHLSITLSKFTAEQLINAPFDFVSQVIKRCQHALLGHERRASNVDLSDCNSSIERIDSNSLNRVNFHGGGIGNAFASSTTSVDLEFLQWLQTGVSDLFSLESAASIVSKVNNKAKSDRVFLSRLQTTLSQPSAIKQLRILAEKCEPNDQAELILLAGSWDNDERRHLSEFISALLSRGLSVGTLLDISISLRRFVFSSTYERMLSLSRLFEVSGSLEKETTQSIIDALTSNPDLCAVKYIGTWLTVATIQPPNNSSQMRCINAIRNHTSITFESKPLSLALLAEVESIKMLPSALPNYRDRSARQTENISQSENIQKEWMNRLRYVEENLTELMHFSGDLRDLASRLFSFFELIQPLLPLKKSREELAKVTIVHFILQRHFFTLTPHEEWQQLQLIFNELESFEQENLIPAFYVESLLGNHCFEFFKSSPIVSQPSLTTKTVASWRKQHSSQIIEKISEASISMYMAIESALNELHRLSCVQHPSMIKAGAIVAVLETILPIHLSKQASELLTHIAKSPSPGKDVLLQKILDFVAGLKNYASEMEQSLSPQIMRKDKRKYEGLLPEGRLLISNTVPCPQSGFSKDGGLLIQNRSMSVSPSLNESASDTRLGLTVDLDKSSASLDKEYEIEIAKQTLFEQCDELIKTKANPDGELPKIILIQLAAYFGLNEVYESATRAVISQSQQNEKILKWIRTCQDVLLTSPEAGSFFSRHEVRKLKQTLNHIYQLLIKEIDTDNIQEFIEKTDDHANKTASNTPGQHSNVAKTVSNWGEGTISEREKAKRLLPLLPIESILEEVRLNISHASQYSADMPEASIDGGLILFWPFLQALFSKLDYLVQEVNEEGEMVISFKSETEKLKARQILVYLLGEHEMESHYFVANILVDLEPEEAFSDLFLIGDDAIQEADTLLSTVITHWDALRDMHPSSFQELFLRRQAFIEVGELGITVKVESKAIDVLMQKLPWGVGTVTLPWLNSQLVFSEWVKSFSQ